MPDLQDIKKSWNKGKKKNPGPQDFKKQQTSTLFYSIVFIKIYRT